MSDGWTDPNHRPLMNVLATTPKGSCFLFAENCQGDYKDAQFTADVWSKGMERVGPEEVFCLVADGASVNTSAASIYTLPLQVSTCHSGEVCRAPSRSHGRGNWQAAILHCHH